jgi:hypothetical protein
MSALTFSEVKKTYDQDFLEVVYHLEMFNSANNYQLFLVGINQLMGYNVKFGFVDKLGNVANVLEKVKSEHIEEFVSNVQNICTQQELTLTTLYTKTENSQEKEFRITYAPNSSLFTVYTPQGDKFVDVLSLLPKAVEEVYLTTLPSTLIMYLHCKKFNNFTHFNIKMKMGLLELIEKIDLFSVDLELLDSFCKQNNLAQSVTKEFVKSLKEEIEKIEIK